MPTRSAPTHALAQWHLAQWARIKNTLGWLALPDIIPLTLLSFNLSPHTQPTRAIMEILKGPLVV